MNDKQILDTLVKTHRLKELKKLFSLVAYGSLSLFVLLCMLSVYAIHHARSLERTHGELLLQETEYKERAQEIRTLSKQLRTLQQQKADLSTSISIADLLLKFSSALPDQTWLTALTKKDSLLTAEGFAHDLQELTSFLDKLTRQFAFVKLVDSQQEAHALAFIIEVHLHAPQTSVSNNVLRHKKR